MNRFASRDTWCLIAIRKGETFTRITRGYKTERDAILAEYATAGPEVFTTVTHGSRLPETIEAVMKYAAQ